MTDWHDEMMKADYNLWQVEDLPLHAKPACAAPLERVGDRVLPRRVDGFVLRNGLIDCWLGYRYRDQAVWTTAISHFAGPWGMLLAEPSAYGCQSTSEVPAQDYVLEIDGDLLPAPLWRVRRARRLRNAPIVNTQAEATPIELSSIDFTPQDPALPLVVRAVKVRNAGPGPRRVAVRCYVGLPGLLSRNTLLFSSDGKPGYHSLGYAQAEPAGDGGLVLSGRGRVLLVNTEPAAQMVAIGSRGQPVWGAAAPEAATGAVADPADAFVRVDLGELAPGEAKDFCLYLVTGPDTAAAQQTLAQARAIGPEQLMKNTLAYYRRGYEGARFRTSDPRVTDLIDALRDCCVQMYGRPRMHIRVGYYWNRAILKCGAPNEARANLLHAIKNWRKGEITNEYHTFGSVSYWYDHAEIPHLLTMFAKDYHDWTLDNDILPEARPMVEACMDFMALTDRNLEIMAGDETYRYCTVTDRWAENADNSFAATCCLEWGARVWPEHAQDWGGLAPKIRAAIDQYMVLLQGRFAHYITANGWRDERPIADIMLRPLLLGYAPSTDPVVRRSVEDVWRYNRLPDGTITTDPAFYQSGQGACMLLQSFGELDSSAAEQYFWSFVDAAPATGGWWEYIDNADTTKCGDRLDGSEPLPSALEGILHYLFGHKPVAGGVEVAPHLPQGLSWARMDGCNIYGQRYDLNVERGAMTLSREGQALFSADRLLRARIVGDSVDVWPIIPTPPYPNLAPARLSWQDGWAVTPCAGLGDVSMTFSPAGRALRYAQRCDGGRVTVELANLSDEPCTCRVLGQSRRLAPQEAWSVSLPAATGGQIAWALLSPYHQRLDAVVPGQAFVLQGRASWDNGAPMQGALEISGGGQETCVELDSQGCFCVTLTAPAEAATHIYRLALRGEGAPEATAAIKVGEDPLGELDDFIGDLEPAAAIVTAAGKGVREAALYIWQEILNLKQLPLPVVKAPLPAGESRNLIVVGDLAMDGLPAALVEGQGFKIYRSPWNPERRLIHVPAVESGDVREMAHGLVQALQLHTKRLARMYRRPEPNESIAIYEFNACHRDWHVAELFGQRPRQPMPVEIEATGLEPRIGNLAATQGLLDLDNPAPVDEIAGPYVRVQAFSSHPFTTTVAVDCDADSPLPVRVRLRVPCGVRMVWIPDISYYWVTGLSPTCHFDGADEVARVWREADGTEVIEISLRPGEPIRPVLHYPPRDWTPAYPTTYRRMEAVFSYLAPDGYWEE